MNSSETPLSPITPPASPPPPVRPTRSGRRWHSGQWRAVSGGLAMITALAFVWALLATFTVRQREADLEAAMIELNELREIVRGQEPERLRDQTVEDMLEDILTLPDPDSL